MKNVTQKNNSFLKQRQKKRFQNISKFFLKGAQPFMVNYIEEVKGIVNIDQFNKMLDQSSSILEQKRQANQQHKKEINNSIGKIAGVAAFVAGISWLGYIGIRKIALNLTKQYQTEINLMNQLFQKSGSNAIGAMNQFIEKHGLDIKIQEGIDRATDVVTVNFKKIVDMFCLGLDQFLNSEVYDTGQGKTNVVSYLMMQIAKNAARQVIEKTTFYKILETFGFKFKQKIPTRPHLNAYVKFGPQALAALKNVTGMVSTSMQTEKIDVYKTYSWIRFWKEDHLGENLSRESYQMWGTDMSDSFYQDMRQDILQKKYDEYEDYYDMDRDYFSPEVKAIIEKSARQQYQHARRQKYDQIDDDVWNDGLGEKVITFLKNAADVYGAQYVKQFNLNALPQTILSPLHKTYINPFNKEWSSISNVDVGQNVLAYAYYRGKNASVVIGKINEVIRNIFSSANRHDNNVQSILKEIQNDINAISGREQDKKLNVYDYAKLSYYGVGVISLLAYVKQMNSIHEAMNRNNNHLLGDSRYHENYLKEYFYKTNHIKNMIDGFQGGSLTTETFFNELKKLFSNMGKGKNMFIGIGGGINGNGQNLYNALSSMNLIDIGHVPRQMRRLVAKNDNQQGANNQYDFSTVDQQNKEWQANGLGGESVFKRNQVTSIELTKRILNAVILQQTIKNKVLEERQMLLNQFYKSIDSIVDETQSNPELNRIREQHKQQLRRKEEEERRKREVERIRQMGLRGFG